MRDMISQSQRQLSKVIILIYQHSDALPFSYFDLQDDEHVVVFGVVLRNVSIAQTKVHDVVPEVAPMAVLTRRLVSASIEATLSLLYHTTTILHVVMVIIVAIV